MLLGLFSAFVRRLRYANVRPLQKSGPESVVSGPTRNWCWGGARSHGACPDAKLLYPADDSIRPARARRQAQTVSGRPGKRQIKSILAFLLITSPLAAQQGFIGDLYQKTAMGTSAAFNNSNPRYNAWTVMYTYSGSGNFSVELDCAPDVTTPGGTPTPGSFTTCSNTVTGSNPSTQALGKFGYITFVGYTPWIETKINSISSGNVTIIAWGFNPADPEAASGSGGCAGTAGTPCIVAGPNAPGTASTKNPVQVAGNDGTNVQAIATDTSGNTKIVQAQPANVTASWTSSTSLNTTLSIPLTGYAGIGVVYVQSGVITQGTLTFEISPDNSNWVAIGVAPVAGTSSLPTTYPLTNGTNAFQMYTGGFFFLLIRTPAIARLDRL